MPTSGIDLGSIINNLNQGVAQQQTQEQNDPLASAIKRIQDQGNVGTYGEGRIGQAVNEFKQLENQMRSGNISQQDYIRIGEGIRNFIKPIADSLLTGGQAPATAATNVGAYDLPRNFYRNLEIYKSGRELLGRDLTSEEFAQVAPSFGSGGQQEVEAGRAALANYAAQQKNTPEALDKKYQQNAGQYSGQVGGIFQELLKRGATQDEIDHFGKLLASGQVDAYTLRQFVTQLPEYRENESAALQAKQSQEDLAARNQLAGELGQYDQDFFKKGSENIISRFAQAGRTGSTALDYALTDLMGQIQKERSAYLSDIARRDYESARGAKREDYLSNKGLLREDYTTNLNRMFGQQDYGQQRGDVLSDMYRSRAYDTADYATQRRDLEALLSQYNNRGGGRSFGGALGAGLQGAGALAPLGPYGAAAGGVAGLFGYLS